MRARSANFWGPAGAQSRRPVPLIELIDGTDLTAREKAVIRKSLSIGQNVA